MTTFPLVIESKCVFVVIKERVQHVRLSDVFLMHLYGTEEEETYFLQ